MDLFTEQKQTHRLRERTYSHRKGRVRGGIDWVFGTDCILNSGQAGPTVKKRKIKKLKKKKKIRQRFSEIIIKQNNYYMNLEKTVGEKY